jgi:peptidyl-prolyl cis-trans isomerase C
MLTMLQKKKNYLAALALSLLTLLPIGPPLISLESMIPLVHAEDIVVATVNGEPIYKAELDPLIVQFKRKSGHKDASAEDKQQLVTNLTVKKLILQHPDGRALKNDPIIFRSVKNYEESLIVNRFIRDYVDANAKVSEDDLRLYYNTHQDQFSVSPELEARVILLRTREDAEKIRERLLAGEDFAKLAETYSIDLPSARKGGSLGVKQRGEIFPQIWRVIIKLKEGEISDVVETEFGYNVLTVDRIISPEVIKPFNDVRAEIRRSILPRKRDKVYLELVEKLQRDAKIEIFEDRFLETSNPSS